METPEMLEARLLEIMKIGAKKAHRRLIYNALIAATSAVGAIIVWEILLKGVVVLASLY